MSAKVASGSLATMLMVIVAWVAKTYFGTPIPAEVQAAAAGLLSALAINMTPERGPRRATDPAP